MANTMLAILTVVGTSKTPWNGYLKLMQTSVNLLDKCVTCIVFCGLYEISVFVRM